MDITTVNLDNGGMTTESLRNQSRVKFEVVNYPQEVPRPPGSFLARFFRAIGAFSPIGMFFGPPGWIAGAAAFGAGQLASVSLARTNSQYAPPPPAPLSYPGLAPVSISGYDGNLIPPAALASGDPGLGVVVSSREGAIAEGIHR